LLIIKEPKELKNFKNFDLGTGKWLEVNQKLINKFADLSGDNQWIHVDVERALSDMPNGQTIAHGLLTLCLSPEMGKGQLKIEKLKLIINYGIDRVRFTSPVEVNSRIRMRSIIKDASDRGDNSILLRINRSIEIEGQKKPAMIAETLSLIYPLN
jgi:acyl dehydratase